VAAAAARVPTRGELEQLASRLREDFPFYAANCLKIVDKSARLVPFLLNDPQRELDEKLEAQRAAGMPQRAIILKSRQVGFSTKAQGKMIHKCTLRAHRRGLVVAQDRPTGAKLWAIGERMYVNLPSDIGHGISVKPPLVSRERGKSMAWGLDSRALRGAGAFDLDSSLVVDTANEIEAGRGGTYTDVHLSEVAFWPHPQKMTSILSGVPDDIDTMVLLESTANSMNFFKTWWDRAEQGDSEYLAFFVGWWRDPTCFRPFFSEEDKAEFMGEIGTGPWGEEEPHLIEQFGCTPEQLHWRRKAIVDRCQSNIDIFHQEYPSSAEEAFILSGEHRFSTLYIQQAIGQAKAREEERPPERGELRVAEKANRKGRLGPVDVPTRVEWAPRQPGRAASAQLWHVYAMPDPAKDYVVAMDPMGGDVSETGDLAFHGIQVIDHRTGEQVAEWMGRGDADLAALEAFKAALFYGSAWLAIETTGGYGTAAAKRFYEDFHYPYVYRRQDVTTFGEKRRKRPGWDTNRETKVMLEENFEELLREQTHGIQSIRTALQLSVYVRDPETGKTGPAEGAFVDLLMALMIAHMVAQMMPVKKRRKSDTVAAPTPN
jgi:hypothetical protein